MKKVFLILSICLLFTGCTLNKRNAIYKLEKRTNPYENRIEMSFGTFSIPSTWVKREDHSTSSKYFFANKNDSKSIPNNISVEMGTNHYSIDDHMSFKTAIQNQLAYQVKSSGATINGSGTTTKNGYVVYTFRVDMGSQITVQHYIVGDYKYVLVHETIWDGDSSDTDYAAKEIVNSFKWKN
jgi:hypothetical protein